jgi:hypothetical protein
MSAKNDWKIIVSDPYFGIEQDHPYSMVLGIQNISGTQKHINFVLDLKSYLEYKIDLQTILHIHFIHFAAESDVNIAASSNVNILDMTEEIIEKWDLLKMLDIKWFNINICDEDICDEDNYAGNKNRKGRDFEDIKYFINVIFDESGMVKSYTPDCVEYDSEYMVYDESDDESNGYVAEVEDNK